jgi:hypothetical protein
VLVFSSNANSSQQIRREVERAVNQGLAVIPLRIEKVPPTKSLEYFISTPHWLDAFSPPLERHLNYLADIIRHILQGEERPEPPPVPGKQPVWRRYPMLTALLAIAAAGAIFAGAWRAFTPPASPPAPTSSVEPAPQAPASGESRLAFASVDTTSAPQFMVAADPFLHEAPIPITVERKQPPESRVVLINNLGLYEGRTVAPAVSQNLLDPDAHRQCAGIVHARFRQAAEARDLHGAQSLSGNGKRRDLPGMARHRPERERPGIELGGRRTHQALRRRPLPDLCAARSGVRRHCRGGILLRSAPRWRSLRRFQRILIEQITLVPFE